MTSYQVIWQGPVTRPGGLGRASREYALALSRQGVDVKVEAGRKKLASGGALARLLRKPYAAGKRKILIYHYLPHTIRLRKERQKYDRIILNTVWETTRVPRNWFPNLNRFDAVFVPSRHNKAALLRSGVKVPIYIVPHGVNTKQFAPQNKKLPVRGTAGRFVFVSVFGFQHRKNPEALLRAYWEEFGPSEKVALVIKTNGYDARETERWIKHQISGYKKRLGLRKTAPVILISSRIPEHRLKGLYTLASAFVLPTRGEGVGLPFLESLASGVPVIATGWGGHMDFVTSRNSFLVNYRLQNPAVSMRSQHSISRRFRHLFAQKGQLWAEPDIGSLKRQMRAAFQHRDVCQRKGRQGRQDVMKLTWNHAGELMKRAVERTIRTKRRR
ncbi:glycosyltransferase family 4 protein [Paenibacillus ehimensis]|uniref:Glycosyltransferase family 4 protein n=1 Tax=Paenibacillus ehimensis TaxID=79264 RepID=A0ABT8VG71_9BACL|nr:glycosyltransferase family 4 protein [Paenibacillus ehimensis]MDO3679960.1 glycosyltransferase family 4 protein [Paenibacillus ehimensis]MEC0212050.1 glycosyltransferase family 4 protein [Paenibacillus ehimensis]